jgi:predicted flap endonuclease-1-like 5' DNA nuclease
MVFTSPLQLFVLCAVAAGGWLLGFLVHPDSARRAATITRLSRELAALRKDAQLRLRDAARAKARLELVKRDLTGKLQAAETAIEALRPRGDDEPVVTESPPLPGFTPTPAPIGPAAPPEPVGGWLRGGARDNLTRIEGIDTPTSIRLFALGITRYADLEHLSEQEVAQLETRLMLASGFIAEHGWQRQATLLRTAAQT